jgi:holo-[acyl-carrier protein] synthase
LSIVSIGFDLAQVEEVTSALTRFGDRYLDRVYTQEEVSQCGPDPGARHVGLAMRFAAKEAVIKALAPGPDEFPGWATIEVTEADTGPVVRLIGAAGSLAEAAGIDEWWLSMDHQRGTAAAMVLAVSRSR